MIYAVEQYCRDAQFVYNVRCSASSSNSHRRRHRRLMRTARAKVQCTGMPTSGLFKGEGGL